MPENRSGLQNNKIISFLMSDSGWTGLIVGILGPLIGFYIYYQLQFSAYTSMHEFLQTFAGNPKLLSKVISLSVLFNGITFFVFIHFSRDHSARAVLAATFIYGAIIAYLNFFT